MNKYLALSAAALLASTAGAMATTYTFTFGSSDGAPYCDGGILATQDNSTRTATWTHTNNNCAGGTSEGAGFLSKIKGLGKVYPMSDNSNAENYGIYSEQFTYVLPARPKDGSRWYLWISLDGVTFFQATAGVLDDVTKNKAHITSTGTKSTAYVVRQVIAAHRNSTR